LNFVHYNKLVMQHQFGGRTCYYSPMTDTPRPPESVRLVRIGEENAGQRIDNFLMTQLKGVPKSHIYRILRTGQVRLNGGRIQAAQRIASGDLVRIPPLRTAPPASGSISLPAVEAFRQRLAARILIDDAELLVINKPSGIAVHGGSGLTLGIIEGLRKLRPEAKLLELVHRLDRDTSGCLVIAKKRSALRSLHEQFRENAVKKSYLALLDGAWTQCERTVVAALDKNVLQSGERLVKASEAGKSAVTVFRRLRRFPTATLVEAEPHTGRTHQIRVHAQFMGHPIAGDERYAPSDRNRAFRQQGLRRLFLHASRLTFVHPGSGQPITVEAPLDSELQTFLDALA
jgi:23S rRNA pseudouridine955/2504/2580 synthase